MEKQGGLQTLGKMVSFIDAHRKMYEVEVMWSQSSAPGASRTGPNDAMPSPANLWAARQPSKKHSIAPSIASGRVAVTSLISLRSRRGDGQRAAARA